MPAKPESEFPTILDLRDGLSRLIEAGLGDLPVQVLVVPDSTMQAIARDGGHTGSRPALMIELDAVEGSARLPATIMSTDRLGKGSTSYAKIQ